MAGKASAFSLFTRRFCLSHSWPCAPHPRTRNINYRAVFFPVESRFRIAVECNALITPSLISDGGRVFVGAFLLFISIFLFLLFLLFLISRVRRLMRWKIFIGTIGSPRVSTLITDPLEEFFQDTRLISPPLDEFPTGSSMKHGLCSSTMKRVDLFFYNLLYVLDRRSL